MQIGLITDSLGHLPLGTVLDFCAANGMSHVEFGTGNWSAAPHFDLAAMRASPARRDEFMGSLSSRGLKLSALNCSGNPLHPGEEGTEHARVIRETIALAAQLGLDRIVTMSGCPAGPGDAWPNWIVTSWPPETTRILNWQWQDVLLPYWTETVALARDHGVRVCLEMHANQCVYNVESFRRLRAAFDETIGVNFDPSHLLWMGADPVAAVGKLACSIYHVHAKDTRVEAAARVNSRLDAKPVMPVDGRSWNFVAVGKGQDEAFWRALVSALRAGGYDDVLSIENEDYALPPEVAVREAAAYLKTLAGGT